MLTLHKDNTSHDNFRRRVGGQKVKTVDAPAHAKQVTLARIKLQQDYAFEAALLAPLRFHWVGADSGVPTAATDCYRTVWLNADFFQPLSLRDTMFVLAHEAYHPALMDGIRRGARDPQLWNIAGDLRINGALMTRGFKTDAFLFATLQETLAAIKSGQPTPEVPGKFRAYGDPACLDMSAEEIYAILEQAVRQNQKGQPDQGQGQDQPCDALPNGMGDDVRPDLAGGECGGGTDSESAGSGPSPSDVAAEMAKRVAGAAMAERAAAKQRGGRTDAWVTRFVDETLAPRVDWRAKLQRMVKKATARDDWSMRRPSRSGMRRGLILPSLYSERTNRIAVCCDTSGSVSDAELQRQASEVAAIIRGVRARETHVAFVDTAVRNTQVFKAGHPVTFEPKGGGGTDFRPGVEWAVGVKPDLLVYFTDGYGSFPTVTPSFPVVWVLVGPGAIKPADVPFGSTVVVEN